MTYGLTRFHRALCGAIAALVFIGPASAAESLNREISFSIAPQSLDAALLEFSKQANLQLMLAAKATGVKQSKGLNGKYAIDSALSSLLKGTGLTYTAVGNTVTIEPLESRPAAGRADSAALQSSGLLRVAQVVNAGDGEKERVTQSADQPAENSKGIPEILVKGSRSSNTDIRRTEDDVQPYVVFDAEDIQRSMAPDLDTFLKTRLPMNQSRGSPGQDVGGVTGNQSSINLRGLGPRQTLILVDGRRMPGVSNVTNDFDQADINGIPISAVERIEILPSTAGGIYGGGATGGVVNIILKHDFNDLQLTARYDGTFAGGGAQRRLDATAGFSLEGGRTHVMATASYRDGQPLYMGDRDFLARSFALQDRNNHAFFYTGPRVMIGYTTNIRSADGSDLVLVDGMRSLNSPIAHVPVGYAGPATDNGAAFLGTADRYNLDLSDDPLSNQYSLLNTPEVTSLQLSLRRQFTDGIEAFIEASRYDNSITRTGSNSDVYSVYGMVLPPGPNNPFVQAVTLAVPIAGYDSSRLRMDSNSLSQQLTGGVIVRLPRQWMVHGEYSLSRSDFDYFSPGKLLSADGEAALADGRLNPLSDVNAYPLNWSAFYPVETVAGTATRPVDQKDATLRVSGPLWALPGGPVRLAALLERREQYSDAVGTRQDVLGAPPVFVPNGRVGSSTDSVYMELNTPLVSATNARPGLQGLEVLASYRYDGTTTRTTSRSPGNPEIGSRTNETTGNQYTLGLSYSPVQSTALRVSYGRGILPPSPSQFSEIRLPPAVYAPLFLGQYLDPKRGGLRLDTSALEVLRNSGGVPLRSEQSTSWSGGVILTPAFLPGFRLSVDYTHIEKTDEITSLGTQTLLDLEDDLPGVIVRNELTAGDAALGYTGGTIREFNTAQVNIAGSLVEAVDVQADYSWQTRLGSFDANVMFSVQPHMSRRTTSASPEIDRVGYTDGPLKWRGNAGLRWSRGAWDLGWNMQYYDASRIYSSTESLSNRNTRTLNQGGSWVADQTYHDLYGRYRFENASGFMGGMLGNTDLQVSIQNVLNTSPPILTTIYYFPFGGYAKEGDPRLRRYAVSFTKRFGR